MTVLDELDASETVFIKNRWPSRAIE